MKKRLRGILNIFNPKKEEVIKDFGTVTVADSWDKVTLKMFENFMAVSDKAKKEERDLTVYDVLPVFSDLTRERIEQMPVSMVDAVMSRLSFCEYAMPEYKPTNLIKIGDDEYMINFYEHMKEKEYEDVMLITKNDPYDYAGILAVLCRKVTGEKIDELSKNTWKRTEDYTSEFANVLYEARKDFWEAMPITKVMPLMAFFLSRWAELNLTSQDFSLRTKEQLDQLVSDIETSLPDMGLPKWRLMLCRIKLRKLKKLIKCI